VGSLCDGRGSGGRLDRVRCLAERSGGFLFGNNSEAARQATRNALQEFELWAAKNPDASLEQFDLVGRKMVDRYRAFTWDSLSAGTGLPAFYSGTRDGLTGPKIDPRHERR